jgi:hypothetical protein
VSQYIVFVVTSGLKPRRASQLGRDGCNYFLSNIKHLLLIFYCCINSIFISLLILTVEDLNHIPRAGSFRSTFDMDTRESTPVKKNPYNNFCLLLVTLNLTG